MGSILKNSDPSSKFWVLEGITLGLHRPLPLPLDKSYVRACPKSLADLLGQVNGRNLKKPLSRSSNFSGLIDFHVILAQDNPWKLEAAPFRISTCF